MCIYMHLSIPFCGVVRQTSKVFQITWPTSSPGVQEKSAFLDASDRFGMQGLYNPYAPLVFHGGVRQMDLGEARV